MATIDHIKSLIKNHYNEDASKFKTTALQIAAYEAKRGHTKSAREIRDMLSKNDIATPKLVSMNRENNHFDISNPNNRLNEIIIDDDILIRIKRILDEFRNRKKLYGYGLANRRKILIEGDSGTGKTLTASIIAGELNLPLYSVRTDKLVTKFMGETSAKLRQVFDDINNFQGVYLFDEFDAIGADRSLDNEVGEMRRILNSFLQFIEQDESSSIIIAATNNRYILDKALYRRFDDVLHYTLPNEELRKMMFKKIIKSYDSSFRITKDLISSSCGLSHAEIMNICNDAIKNSILYEKEITKEQLIKLVNQRSFLYEKGVNDAGR